MNMKIKKKNGKNYKYRYQKKLLYENISIKKWWKNIDISSVTNLISMILL